MKLSSLCKCLQLSSTESIRLMTIARYSYNDHASQKDIQLLAMLGIFLLNLEKALPRHRTFQKATSRSHWLRLCFLTGRCHPMFSLYAASLLETRIDIDTATPEPPTSTRLLLPPSRYTSSLRPGLQTLQPTPSLQSQDSWTIPTPSNPSISAHSKFRRVILQSVVVFHNQCY